MNENLPKVLVCGPQHVSKMYAWERWYERTYCLTYPNYDIFLSDNSPTIDNTNYLNTFDGIVAAYCKDNGKGLLERINESHKQCAEYALKNGYDYILHYETDVIAPYDIIERLLSHNYPIVCGTYDIRFGKERKAMVQLKENFDRTNNGWNVVEFLGVDELQFFNGKLKDVYHAGLGCALISRSVLKEIKFRVVKGNGFHTDTWFANDCFQSNNKIKLDTSVQCVHLNQTWTGVVPELIDNL